MPVHQEEEELSSTVEGMVLDHEAGRCVTCGQEASWGGGVPLCWVVWWPVVGMCESLRQLLATSCGSDFEQTGQVLCVVWCVSDSP